MAESRQHFQASVCDEQIAVVNVGLERVAVKILDQSSGGLCMFAKRCPDFPCDSLADVSFTDGLRISGRIKYVDRCEEGCRIGFHRSEMIEE